MYKLVLTDMDNTLLSNDKTISKKNKEAINLLKENNIMFSLASGRCPVDLKDFVKELGLENSYHIGNSGLSIFGPNGFLKHMGEFKKDVYNEIVKYLEDNKIEFATYSGDEFFYTNQYLLLPMAQSYFKRTKTVKIKDFKEVKNPFKFTVLFNNEKELKLVRELEEKLSVSTLIVDKGLVEIFPVLSTKYTAALQIADMLNIKNNEIAGIGDEENDFELVKKAGLGVAVKNATEHLKSVAKVVLDKTNEEDAIYHLVKDYIIK